MTDSDNSTPDAPGAGATPPPPPPPPSGGSTNLGDLAAGTDASSGQPGATPAPGVEPTTQMPETEAAAAAAAGGMAAAGGGVPPADPLDSTFDDPDAEEPVPWYKKPAWIAVMVVVALLLLGLIAWLIFGGSDDDDTTSPTVSRLVLETIDETGEPVEAGFVVSVTGPAGAETAYQWLRPADTAPGEPAVESSGSDGRAEFLWEPDSTVEDPATWAATVSFVGQLPPGWTAPGPVVDCIVARLDEQEQSVSLNVAVDVPDITVDRVVTYTFPNYAFVPGDSVTCRLDSVRPTVETTVVETTVVETTVVETTVVETTVVETTVAPTTALPTTVPTTVPSTTTTLAPAPTAYDALDAAGNFTEFLAAVDQVPTVSTLLKGPGPITVFAPNDDAFDGVTVPTDPAQLEQLLLSHIVDGESLDAADVLALAEVEVATGGAQPVDAAATPDPTIGGAGIIGTDIASENGFSHELDAIMPVAPAP